MCWSTNSVLRGHKSWIINMPPYINSSGMSLWVRLRSEQESQQWFTTRRRSHATDAQGAKSGQTQQSEMTDHRHSPQMVWTLSINKRRLVLETGPVKLRHLLWYKQATQPRLLCLVYAKVWERIFDCLWFKPGCEVPDRCSGRALWHGLTK